MSSLILPIVFAIVCLAGAWLLLRRGRARLALLVLAGVPLAAAAAFALQRHDTNVPSAPDVALAHASSPGWSGIAGLGDATAPAAAGARADSLEAVTTKLAQRLEREPDDAAGWQLLGQSYRYLGRSAEAERAFARARELGVDTSGAVAGTPAGGAAATAPSAVSATTRSEADQLRISGERARVRRDFAAARRDFERLTQLAPQDPDAWADFADAAAATAGGKLEKSAPAIDRALALDPRHRKALWLRASLELQQGRHAAAAATWQQLLKLVAPGSSDARVIEANLREARSLMAATPAAGGG